MEGLAGCGGVWRSRVFVRTNTRNCCHVENGSFDQPPCNSGFRDAITPAEIRTHNQVSIHFIFKQEGTLKG